MSTAWTRIARMLGVAIPTSIAVMAMGSGAAWAQTTWNIEGSDTLNSVIKDAITLSGARLKYGNPGSGQAEHDMLNDSSAHYVEGIGPMSRNFTYSVLQAHTSPNWEPTSPDQVLCLDAAVLTVKNKNPHLQNITVTPPPGPSAISDLAIILGGYPKGCWGSAPAACNITYGASQNPPVSNVNMSAGTTQECAHPERLAALQRLTSSATLSRIDHIFRRDDKSGTQDTWREWMQFTNWCNGKSEGNTNAVGSNMKNEDLDPIRRQCEGGNWTLHDPNSPYDPNTNPYVSGTKQVTKCSYYPLAKTCNANDPDIGPGTAGGDYFAPDPSDQTKTVKNAYGVIRCSQGLVVAISESDDYTSSLIPPNPAALDITQSIGQRVAGQVSGFDMGLAGLASNVAGTFAVKINTNAASFANIHTQTYLLSRRLFLQRATDVQATEDPDRATQENVLYDWVTNHCNVNPLCLKYGFVPTLQGADAAHPLADCSDACTNSKQKGNAGGCGKADPGVGTPKQNVGAEGEAALASTNAYPCVKDGNVLTSGYCPLIPTLTTGYECNVANASVSGPDTTDYPPNGAEGLGAEPSVKCDTGRCNIDGTLLTGICCDPTLTPPAAGACPLPLLP
jgi:hypothetical protein